MKKIIYTIIVMAIFPTAYAGSLNDFFNKNPDLQKNTEARMIIKDQASWLALDEASNEGRDNLGSRRDQLLRDNGEDYANVALKNFKLFCAGKSSSYLTTKPDEETCKFFNNYQSSSISKDENKAREAIQVLKNSFSNACVHIGNGDDKGAMKEINEAIYPGGQKNPYPMDDSTFQNIKDFYMQYRVLNKKNCDYYTEELIKRSSQN